MSFKLLDVGIDALRRVRIGRSALVVGAICVATAPSPSLAAEQTLAVSLSGGALRVAVPANAYDDTSKLYIVWGAADHGAEISAWPLANRRAYAGTLSASAATYEISADGIPAESVVRAIVTSDVRLIDGWVSLSNGQYVDTGIKGNEAYGTEIKFRCTGASAAWASVARTKDENQKPAGYVLTWPGKPENVEFVLDAASKKDGYKLTANDTGLLLTRHIGLRIIVK